MCGVAHVRIFTGKCQFWCSKPSKSGEIRRAIHGRWLSLFVRCLLAVDLCNGKRHGATQLNVDEFQLFLYLIHI